jgi:YfiH family protein
MMTNNGVAMTVSQAAELQAVMAFSVRTGGKSPHPMDSLNFSVSQGDSRENVLHNLAVFGAFVGVDPNRIATCRQVHKDNVALIDEVPSSLPEADAIVSLRPGVFPAIKTADCLAILLLDPVNKISAAIHAGWRGTALGITGKVTQFLMDRFGTDPGNLVASLGPAIGPCCYEVDEVALGPFRANVPDAERFISVKEVPVRGRSSIRKSYRLDLEAANQAALLSAGLPAENIYTAGMCTCCNSDLFYSYRRDGARSGRHIAVVGFKNDDPRAA